MKYTNIAPQFKNPDICPRAHSKVIDALLWVVLLPLLKWITGVIYEVF